MTWDKWLYFPSEGRRADDFFALKNPTALAGFEPANLGSKGQHTTSRPLKPLTYIHTYIHSFIHFTDPIHVIRQLNMKQIMTKQQTPQIDKLKTYDKTPNNTIFLVTKEYYCYTLLYTFLVMHESVILSKSQYFTRIF